MSTKKLCQSIKAEAKLNPRGLASQAKTRDRIGMARIWYIRAFIPAEVDRVEVKQPSLDAVAQAAGLPLVTVHRRSREEGWVDQRETFANLALEAENRRLIRTLADQHSRSRAAYFRSSMRLQSAVERKLAQDGEALDMVALSAAGSALAKAQKVSDTAVLGTSEYQKNQDRNGYSNSTGWMFTPGKRPSPELQAMLAKLDEKDGV